MNAYIIFTYLDGDFNSNNQIILINEKMRFDFGNMPFDIPQIYAHFMKNYKEFCWIFDCFKHAVYYNDAGNHYISYDDLMRLHFS